MRSKRTMDLALGCLGLAVVAPVFLVLYLAMRITGDRGPFLYRATRVGKGGRSITVLKIRTMVQGSDGSRLTSAGDARITRVGGALRRYRIDELPQLINVVRGDMSLVGPRPEDPSFVDLSDPIHRKVFTALPGITGLAQLEYHDEARSLSRPDAEQHYRDVILPAKLRLDVEYLDHRSIAMDVRIVLRTLRAVLGR